MFGTLAKNKIQPCNLPMIHAVALGEQVGSHACRCTTSMCGPVGGRVMRTHRDPKLLRDGSDINSQCNALVWLAYVAAGCGLCGISTNTPRSRGSICRSVESQMVDVFPSAKCMRNAAGFHKVTLKILQELQTHDLQNVRKQCSAQNFEISKPSKELFQVDTSVPF